MEAARVAALRGHSVTLWEEEAVLGGQLIIAAVPPGKQEFLNFIKYITAQFQRLGVQVTLGKKAAASEILFMKPDAVVVATGSSTPLPDLEGSNLPNVILARDALAGKGNIGKKIVVVGSGRIGCEAAVTLAEQGRDVTVIGGWPGELGGSTLPVSRNILLTKLRKYAKAIEPDTLVVKVIAQGVVVKRDGQEGIIEADTVVLSPAAKCNTELAGRLKGAVAELHVIGDATEIGCIGDATLAGFRTGCLI